MKNRRYSSFSSNHPGAFRPIILIVMVQHSFRGKEWNKFFPPNSSYDLCLFFCLYPSSMHGMHTVNILIGKNHFFQIWQSNTNIAHSTNALKIDYPDFPQTCAISQKRIHYKKVDSSEFHIKNLSISSFD